MDPTKMEKESIVIKEKITSAGTSVNKLPAVAKLVAKKFPWVHGTINFDNGAGKYDQLTEYLSHVGVRSFPYDPYNRTDAENALALASGPYDTVTVSDLLCVIQDKEERDEAVKLSYDVLKLGGRAFFTCYNGDESGVGKVTKNGWQENRQTATYVEEISAVFSDVTRYGKLIVAVR